MVHLWTSFRWLGPLYLFVKVLLLLFGMIWIGLPCLASATIIDGFRLESATTFSVAEYHGHRDCNGACTGG